MNIFLDIIPFEERTQPKCTAIQTVVQEKPQTKQKSDKYKLKNKKPMSNSNYRWTTFEKRRYLQFLKAKGHIFRYDRPVKIKIKVNILMSNYILTKNASQCHSHHQKMVIKYGTIENIIGTCKVLQDQAEGKIIREVINDQSVQDLQLIQYSQKTILQQENDYKQIEQLISLLPSI